LQRIKRSLGTTMDRPLREDEARTPPTPDDAGEHSRNYSREFALIALDVLLSAAFWSAVVFFPWGRAASYVSLVGLVTAMVVWRVWRVRRLPQTCPEVQTIPYTCGYAASNGKEVFLVATVHISPRAPRDVETVVDGTRPDVVLIELDEERLDSMRAPVEAPRVTLQPCSFTEANNEPIMAQAQRALWNGEMSGQTISGSVVFQEENPYGTGPWGEQVRDRLALVQRGGPADQLHMAAFSLKAHRAAKAGARALVVINWDGELPVSRLGGGSLMGDFRIAARARSCSFPPIPMLLLPKAEGEQLRAACRRGGPGHVQGEFQVIPDDYPRRSLRRRICQSCALVVSGVSILYGVIECFNIDVGAEFTAAENAASVRGIVCACIDVDLNRLCNRLSRAMMPTPCNLGSAVLSWLALPRVAVQVIFPPQGHVDVVGGTILHAASFRFRTWVGFALAGLLAGGLAAGLLLLFGEGVAGTAEHSGMVDRRTATQIQAYVVLGIEFFAFARLYEAVSASRDEAMYRGVVSKARDHEARRVVVVCGAAHANGILQRVRTRGL